VLHSPRKLQSRELGLSLGLVSAGAALIASANERIALSIAALEGGPLFLSRPTVLIGVAA
jgi:hypothetical protein